MLSVVKHEKMILDKNGYCFYQVVKEIPINATFVMNVSDEIGIGGICYKYDGLYIGGHKLWLSSGGNYGEIIPTHPLREEILEKENLPTYLFAQFIHYNITEDNFVNIIGNKVIYNSNNKPTSAIPSKISRLLAIAIVFELENTLKQFDDLIVNEYENLNKNLLKFALNSIYNYVQIL